MRRLRIVHRTGYAYDAAATASYNEARMLPAADPQQVVLGARLGIHPGLDIGLDPTSERGIVRTASQHEYADYYGTRVTSFEVLAPHDRLTLVASSTVEVRRDPADIAWTGTVTAPVAVASIDDWSALAVASAATVETSEQLLQTARTAPPVAVVELARGLADDAGTPADAALAILHAIGDHIAYVQGVTGVATTAAQAWVKRKGVCQDITHIALGALRSVGIPARYVSGYLQPKADAGIGETVEGESHAWVEWYDGGWHGFDPTNRLLVGDRHVRVGRGRDYGDVAPLRGVFSGEGASHLFVSVEITREA